ncbi:copper homeostasis protein CutC [Rhizobium halophytocola]|uniref:PF03932 family protein CutC n=1 Tax=Rhizobium halophytocola TaxID=735519 RepID=A0ABS4E4X3_9HYPH|nr:copper homeostasis protein CutC [Rhizobium halophytocola]MBP1853001.1 copper homeostasis protein [Rhizobium halophytocola]
MPNPKASERRLEVCVETEAGLRAAINSGADRIELCSALSVGGLTPSAGFMRLAAEASVPVHALIRPRAGSFVHDAAERDIITADIREAKAAGLAGVVIGALTCDNRLDLPALRQLVDAADGLSLTLSRAFDLVEDPLVALEEAISLGFSRILTSGCAPSAPHGLETLRRLAARADGRIGLLPGGGVRAENAPALLAINGICELHASCGNSRPADDRLSALGFSDARDVFTDTEKVRALKRAMQIAGP